MANNSLLKKTEVAIKNRFNKRNGKIWLFGEWFGNKCCDNSLFLANYVVEHDPSVRVYWAANKGANLELLDKRVKVIERDTPKSIEIYKKAGVVCMNQGIQDFSDAPFNYFAGAVTVNMWHGVPWKKIFLDSAKTTSLFGRFADYMAIKMSGAKYYQSLSKEFDYILSTSAKVKSRNIIRAGYPRNSMFYDSERCNVARDKIISLINAEKASNKGAKDFAKKDSRIIAYMPTFRDSGQKVFSFNSIVETELYDYLVRNNIVIVEKNHYADVNGSSEATVDNKCVVNLPDCNAPELLAAADILITDYSSCFFDYLVLDRPIIHYIYDYEYYSKKDRGLYYGKSEVLCGDGPTDIEGLTKSIKDAVENPDKDSALRAMRRKRFMTYENENGCRDIYEFILKKLKR